MNWFENFYRKYCLKQLLNQIPTFLPPLGVNFQLSDGDTAPTIRPFRPSQLLTSGPYVLFFLSPLPRRVSPGWKARQRILEMSCLQCFSFNYPFFTLRVCNRSISYWGYSPPLQQNIQTTEWPLKMLILTGNAQKILSFPVTSQQLHVFITAFNGGLQNFILECLLLYYSFSCWFSLNQKKDNILLF